MGIPMTFSFVLFFKTRAGIPRGCLEACPLQARIDVQESPVESTSQMSKEQCEAQILESAAQAESYLLPCRGIAHQFIFLQKAWD